MRTAVLAMIGLTVVGLAAILPGSAAAFLPPTDTVGPLTVTIADPGEVMALDSPIAVPVTLTNSAATPLDGTLSMGVTDEWRVMGNSVRPFHLDAGSRATIPITVQAGKGTYAALYPVHARATFQYGGVALTAHAILIVSVAPSAVMAAAPVQPLSTVSVPARGAVGLDNARLFRTTLKVHDRAAVQKPPGWQGTDEETGTNVQLVQVDRGGERHAIGVHPPWRVGWGDAYLDYKVALPSTRPLTLEFATAIRDNGPTEPPSDGVEFEVQVSEGGAFKTLYDHFSAAKRWEPARVDLSAYAGHTVTLRLLTDPGPAHNTSCDQSYWAEPTIVAGSRPVPETAAARAARRDRAVAAARAALQGRPGAWSWKLTSTAATTGVAMIPGPLGAADAFFAFTDGEHSVVFDGFTMEIDNSAPGSPGLAITGNKATFADGRGTIREEAQEGGIHFPVQVEVWGEKGALRLAFSMPGVKRDARGEPRFTSLMIGAASEKALRVYAGFGNVLEDPGAFDLNAGGFTLSTRHVGMDFTGGLSLVQAVDIFPDSFHVAPDTQTYALRAHHDATFSFIPSSHGAFAAAHAYRQISGFHPAGGVAKLLGRMCLDQWGGSYRADAAGIEQAARYGLTDSVYVQHVWQRWGYDYRLPDITPQAGSLTDFRAMVDACTRNGILYAPHDNYIDFYPDATGYSYNPILFNADGTPQKAWYNEGRKAQSYRWSPISFGPWLDRNLKDIKALFAPTAYFVDVFSAIAPMDFYDRAGRFYPKTVTLRQWGAAFDKIRAAFGGAPTISEAGADGLIGHLDAGESDHSGWVPPGTPGGGFRWDMPAADAERIPWHDMASHGNFVLMAGGLGNRYAGGGAPDLHGYASDDYLCTTVMGGRNPMAEGPFSRGTVMTYYLLHDMCDALAHSDILGDEFAGDDIHRQTVRFSGAGTVEVNRGKTDWMVDGSTLPPYGFMARSGGQTASIARRDGLISGMAQGPGTLFVDARADSSEAGLVGVKVAGVDDLGGGKFRLRVEWDVLRPPPPGFRPFLHFVDAKTEKDHEGIVFQGPLELSPEQLAAPGHYSTTSEIALPADAPAPAVYAIRLGLYNPTGGARLPLLGPLDESGRVRGGEIRVDAGRGIQFVPGPADPDGAARRLRQNLDRKVIDFGPAATNGSFRLLYNKAEWELIPLPGSPSFETTLRLDQLGAAGRKVASITAVLLDGPGGGPATFQQDGNNLHFSTSGGVFEYRVRFE